MKVVVDARMLGKGGIGTYLENLLPYLEKWCDLRLLESHAPIYSFKEQADFFLKIPRCDLFWSPHFNAPIFPIGAKKRIVTIHDLFHLDCLSNNMTIKRYFRRVTKKADQIITVSEFSKSRLLYYFPDLEDKLTVIHSGAEHLTKVAPKEVENLPKSFYLFVGNPKPHKNLQLLIDANIPLVIVGEGYERVERNNLHYLGRVAKSELCWLYQNAQALLFPSHYEGWGLPAIEAMSLGCPVLASRAGSIPEVCQDAALYFNPRSKVEFMATLAMDRKGLIEKGKKRAERLTWEQTAKSHFTVFETVLSENLAAF